jgi:thiol-disulfide isomerase/thioredoxin
MRRLVVAAALVCTCLLTACDPATPDAPAPARFASVGKATNDQAGATFCEKQWPAAPAPGARRYREIPARPLPDGRLIAPASGGAWKWVNLWATWCLPCVEEMRLLARWQRSLEEDGVGLDLESWSVDEDEATLGHFLETTAVPGRVHWLRSQQDLPAVLAALGADSTAGVPVHALIDPSGSLRCLRVGAVHDEDYGAVKTLLSGH